MTSILGGAIVVLTIVPLVLTTIEYMPNPEREAAQAAERRAWEEQEKKRVEEADAADARAALDALRNAFETEEKSAKELRERLAGERLRHDVRPQADGAQRALQFVDRGVLDDIADRAGTQPQQLTMRVHNHGKIPDEVMERLFSGGPTNHRGSSGLGLGLYIVDQIVRAHGGAVRLRSAPGAGTTFTVLLPALASPAAVDVKVALPAGVVASRGVVPRIFRAGDEILVVEEKRQVIEYQLKEELYNWRPDVRPNVVGKFDEGEGDFSGGEWARPNPTANTLLRANADLTPALIARAIAKRLCRLGLLPAGADLTARIDAQLAILEAKQSALNVIEVAGVKGADRQPWFCSGCPHNTSTRVPEGSRAMAGIGCHYMVNWMPDRRTSTFTQMGGEGVTWVGQQPFTTDAHIFANLGDGTYFHSGLLAIRQSIAAGVNITYKVLYNDAVAMTGGQPHDGTLSVPIIARQLLAEGVGTVVVVNDGAAAWDDVVRTVGQASATGTWPGPGPGGRPVGHDLAADTKITYCPSCGHSLNPEDRQDEHYIAETQCRHCDGHAPSNADYLAEKQGV